MSSTSVSSLDVYEAGLSGFNATEKTASNTDSGRLHALEQLEVLPQILHIREGSPSGGHKELATELLDALQAHISYISCLVFGTHTERLDLMNLLHNKEAPLLGGGRDNRLAYHSDLQLWIAATLYATSTDIYQRVYGRIDYKSAQRAYSEFTLLMNCLGIHPNTWPVSRQAFWTYWDHQITQLTVSPDMALFAKDLHKSTEMPQWVQSLKPLLRAVTIEMLPPSLREAYELRSTATTRALYRTWVGFSVTLYPAMPKKWRSYPLKFYQDFLRERLEMA